MDGLTWLVFFVGISALVIQSGSCLITKKRSPAIGFVDAVLAVITFLIYLSLLSGQMIIGTEFGIIMVQGYWTRWLLGCTLVLTALLPALVWHRVRQLNGWGTSLYLWLLASIPIGSWAASRVFAFNPGDPEAIRVYLYDAWWPPLVVWVIVCFSGILFALLKADSTTISLAFAALLLAGLAKLVLRFEELPDGWSRPLWTILEIRAIAIAVVLFVSLLYKWPKKRPSASTELLPKKPRKRLEVIATTIALAVIAISLIDLLAIGFFDRAIDLFIFLVCWLPFAERLDEYALETLFDWLKGVKKKLPGFLSASAQRVCKAASGGLNLLIRDPGVTVKVLTAAFLVIFIVIFMLATIVEAGNYRKTVIETFRWTGSDSTKDKDDISKVLADSLINALNRLHYDLRTDLISMRRSSSGEHPVDTQLVETGTESKTLEAGVSKSSDLKVGEIKIPLQLLYPIDQIMQALFRIRLIRGVVSNGSESAGSYIVLVNSSNGESWRGTTDETSKPTICDPLTHLAEPTSSARLTHLAEKLAFEIATSDQSLVTAGMTKSWEAFEYFRSGLHHYENYKAQKDLSAELHDAIECFRAAVRNDRSFALAHYRLGLALRSDGQPGAAIDAFRDSAAVNSEFVPGILAHAETLYNYESYYPPNAAILGPKRIPEAYFPSRVSLPGRWRTPWDIRGQWEKRDEARRMWADLSALPQTRTSTSEKRAVYFNLCTHELEARRRPGFNKDDYNAYLAYFFCTRAAAMFYRLTAVERASLEQRTMQSQVLTSIGDSLVAHERGIRLFEPDNFRNSWSCNSTSVVHDLREDGRILHLVAWGSKLSRQAMSYYERSLEFGVDTHWAQCNAAITIAYVAGDTRPMERLLGSARARFSVAFSFAEAADVSAHSVGPDGTPDKERASVYYRLALDNYAAAIRVNPSYVEALIGYAHTLWKWRLDVLGGRAALAPEAEAFSEAFFQAERYAREAIRLTAARRLVGAELGARKTLAEVLLAEGRFGEAKETLGNAQCEIALEAVGSNRESLEKAKEILGKARIEAKETAENAQCEIALEAVGSNKESLENAKESLAKARIEIAQKATFWKSFNEARWDLALATICLNRKQGLEQAVKVLNDIRMDETSRERHQLSDAPDALDLAALQAICPPDPEKANSATVSQYSMKEPVYEAGPVCSWSGVVAEVSANEASKGEPIYLHVWGGGVDQRISLDKTARSIQLEVPPRATHQYYFARLEDARRRDLSGVRSFDTYENTTSNGGQICTKNQVRLIFERSHVGGRPAGEGRNPETSQGPRPAIERRCQGL